MESYTYRELDDMIKERTKDMSIAERVNFKLGAEWWFEISNYKLCNCPKCGSELIKYAGDTYCSDGKCTFLS